MEEIEKLKNQQRTMEKEIEDLKGKTEVRDLVVRSDTVEKKLK